MKPRENNKDKLRIAYVGWTEPGGISGATLALQRHLYDGREFEVIVATDKPYRGLGPESQWIELKRPHFQERLSRTRARRAVAHYEMLLEPYLIATRLHDVVREFRPDVILTIPDNSISWSAFLLSQRLGVPLVCNFQDWWPRGQFHARHQVPCGLALKWLEKRFWHLYQKCKVAYCTSQGFQRYLGTHPDAPLLYPCPAARPQVRPGSSPPGPDQPIRLIYGGTIRGHYGRKVLALAKACADVPHLEFRVFGGKPDWTPEDLRWAEQAGVYRGSLSQEAYRGELAKGDVFITIMTDAPELRIMMETSFTTKFLEYCQFGKPTIVWGPPYCEPVRIARLAGAGLAVEDEDPLAVIAAAECLRDPVSYAKLSEGAWRAATTIFDPASIHDVFRHGIQRAARQAV